jgi:hypothetical protein
MLCIRVWDCDSPVQKNQNTLIFLSTSAHSCEGDQTWLFSQAKYLQEFTNISPGIYLHIKSYSKNYIEIPCQSKWEKLVLCYKLSVKHERWDFGEMGSLYLLTRSVGKPCSSKRQSSLYKTEPNSSEYCCGVKAVSTIPFEFMRAFLAVALISIVFLKCGTMTRLIGCSALSCRLVAIMNGSTAP